MKKKLILAALLMSMAVTVFAEEQIVWEDQTAVDDPAFVFEEEDTDQIVSEEQTASEEPEYVFEEPEIIEETTDEETVFEEIAFDEAAAVSEEANLIQESSVFEEELVTEEVASEQTSAVDIPHAAEGLIYTGEPQELITAQGEMWLYSLDGEHFTDAIPTAINAGTYTVYLREGDKDPVSITVTIAKADVIFTPPVANTTSQSATDEPDGGNEEPGEGAAEPAYAAGEENEVGEGVAESAYSGEEPAYADEVVFEVVFE